VTTFLFQGGPFDGQTLVVDMIETTRGPAAPEEVRLEVVRTSVGVVAKVSADGEVYRLDDGRYVWVAAD
jgi:hypothetical protein